MSYYCFNKPQLLQKAQDKYHNCGGKENSDKYYIANKESFFFFLKKKKKANNKYRSLSKEEKEAKREYGRNMYKNMKKSVEELKYYFFCTVQK